MILIIAIELALLAGLMWMVLREQLMEVFDDLDKMSHDLQQVKTRLHWSRERELTAKSQRDEFGFIAPKSRRNSRNTAGIKKIKYVTK